MKVETMAGVNEIPCTSNLWIFLEKRVKELGFTLYPSREVEGITRSKQYTYQVANLQIFKKYYYS